MNICDLSLRMPPQVKQKRRQQPKSQPAQTTPPSLSRQTRAAAPSDSRLVTAPHLLPTENSLDRSTREAHDIKHTTPHLLESTRHEKKQILFTGLELLTGPCLEIHHPLWHLPSLLLRCISCNSNSRTKPWTTLLRIRIAITRVTGGIG